MVGSRMRISDPVHRLGVRASGREIGLVTGNADDIKKAGGN